MGNNFRKRVISGIGANSLSMILAIFTQLLSLPIYLHYWGVSKYGAWVILSAIPSYLAMVDMGLVPTAGNKMTMALAVNDIREANKIFQSSFAFISLISLALLVIITPLIVLIDIPDTINIVDYKFALGLLCFGVLISMYIGLIEAIFRSTERYSEGTYLITAFRLLEWVFSIVGLILIGNFSAVAAGMVIIRCLSLIFLTFKAISGSRGISLGFYGASIAEFKVMVKPAISFTLMPLASSLSLQGVILLVGQTLGVNAVVQFSSYRTLARTTVQFNSILSWTLWPEFSRFFGVGGINQVKSILVKGCKLGFITSFITSIFLYLASPLIIKYWTNGEVSFDPILMFILCIYSAIGGSVHIPKAFLLSINHHIKLSIFIVLNSLLLMFSSIVLGRYFGLSGFGLATLLAELFTLVACLYLIRELFHK